MIEWFFSKKPYKNFNLHSIDKSWWDFFQKEEQKKYFPILFEELEKKYVSYNCCPSKEDIFRLFREISLSQIKVIILGQDPYHIPGVADGIAFSSKKKEYLPATLKNIFLELVNDLGCPTPKNSNLLPLVKEGVFLLNTALTVSAGKPLSHFELWEDFTNSLIEYIINKNKKIIWVFWGKKAREIKQYYKIDEKNILISAHPSPFSAEKYGFFGSKPFSKINKLLADINESPINWLVI